jgi:hypothetical protein
MSGFTGLDLLKTTTLGGNPEANVAIATAMLGGMGGGPGASTGSAGMEGLFGAGPGTSAMSKSLMAPEAATPWVTEAATSGDALAKFLSPETFGMGAPPGAESSFPWGKVTDALGQMKNDTATPPTAMGSRPPGYDPKASMEDQFAAIMGWLKENGGRV